ncbi:MAG: hypothetical protein M3Q30_19405 [Actinomycetota bacterium]|nr:hypothetical protein [Actinomycetota bacterium]
MPDPERIGERVAADMSDLREQSSREGGRQTQQTTQDQDHREDRVADNQSASTCWCLQIVKGSTMKYLADRSEQLAAEDEDETPDRHERGRHDQERRRGSAVRTRQYRKRHRTIIARFTTRTELRPLWTVRATRAALTRHLPVDPGSHCEADGPTEKRRTRHHLEREPIRQHADPMQYGRRDKDQKASVDPSSPSARGD